MSEGTEKVATPKAIMLIEGMKRLKVIEKRMESNMNAIGRYSSGIDTMKEAFGSAEGQKKEVDSLIQSNTDLMEEYISLKERINHTNLTVKVALDGKNRSLNEWLILKRKMARMMELTFGALSEHAGQRMLLDSRTRGEEKQPNLQRYYDEDAKNKGMRKWQDLFNDIDARLEVVNATTPLMDLPS